MQSNSGVLKQAADQESEAAPCEESSEGVERLVQGRAARNADITWHYGVVSSSVRERLLHQRPATVWLTGLSGAGKSTIAFALEKLMLERGHNCFVVDGDNLRHHLNSDLGFSPADRRENIRRAAEVAHLLNEAGLIVITAFISPFQDDRAMAREIIGEKRYIEVYVNTSSEVCEERDPKGLYAKARRGEIPEFTGVSAPYEAPVNADLEISTEMLSTDDAAEILYRHLTGLCFIK
ncbi:MAG: adenylyl-sulfate kinase [Burkholderiales bacterium]|nr:adenylyl-sulfate kinase [Burkholderiales bacterium]